MRGSYEFYPGQVRYFADIKGHAVMGGGTLVIKKQELDGLGEFVEPWYRTNVYKLLNFLTFSPLFWEN